MYINSETYMYVLNYNIVLLKNSLFNFMYYVGGSFASYVDHFILTLSFYKYQTKIQ